MDKLPVVIIGAGPVGLAAAAHLHKYGQEFVIFEQGETVGSNIREWGHVQLFSPWQYNMDKAAKELLIQRGWQEPNPEVLPTGEELAASYLEPLAALDEIQRRLQLDTEVTAITKQGMDKLKSSQREKRPFAVYTNEKGKTQKVTARAIIDTSGTWQHPNPPFADGVWQQSSLKDKVYAGIPNMKTMEARYANKHIAVVGSGHSALNTLMELTALKDSYPKTAISWIIRKDQVQAAFGGEEKDQLKARGELGSKTHELVDQGAVHVYTGFRVDTIMETQKHFTLKSETGVTVPEVDEIIVNTGARPDFSFLQELRLAFDPIVESTPALAPLIDPNLHSCGTVRAHGEKELRHPEANFYIAGVKSYGRAPTFLMATGYEQVRSIAAYLAGDLAAADRVELELPETGVCEAKPAPKPFQIIGDATGASCGPNGCC